MTANYLIPTHEECLRLVASGVTLTETDGRVIVSHPCAPAADLAALQFRVDKFAGAVIRLMREGREYVYRAPVEIASHNAILVKQSEAAVQKTSDFYTKQQASLFDAPVADDPRLTAFDRLAAANWAGWVEGDTKRKAQRWMREHRYSRKAGNK